MSGFNGDNHANGPKFEYAVFQRRSEGPHRGPFEARVEADEWIADGEADGMPKGMFYVARRAVGGWDHSEHSDPASIPTEWTLGWCEFANGQTWLGFVRDFGQNDGTFTAFTEGCLNDTWAIENVVAFTPATPVPHDALNALSRRMSDCPYEVEDDWGVVAFMNAVDEANT